jgi:hypothetical protein
VKPSVARKLGLAVGEAVRATGILRSGADAVVLRAHTVEAVQSLGKRHVPGTRATE